MIRRVRQLLGSKRADGLMLLSLVGMAVAVFWRLALTELIIARGDLFFYFYPYRDFASTAVRAGRVPLWNPFLFMGAPFLANSQAGFFYPFNLALAWMPVERMVNASIVLHAALAAIGAYLWGRGGLGLRRPGAWLAGLCYGLGGYFVAQVEHLNQVQVLAWLPWLLWLYAWRVPTAGHPVRSRVWTWIRCVGLALVIALQFLAGHTQSVFICLLGLACYALLPALWDVFRRRTRWQELVQPLGVLVAATLLGAALAAVQLLPTLQLSNLSIRSGGLPYKEAVSFSLRPGLLGRSLLPAWGAPLFPEFVAYVGVVGLALATVGVLVHRRVDASTFPLAGEREGSGSPLERVRLTRRGALALAILGLFLALGGFNPVYLVLVKLVPGFGLFRAPARWLALYGAGVAGLVGIGLDELGIAAEAASGQRALRRYGRGWLAGGALIAGLVLLGQLLGGDQEPDLAPSLQLWSLIGWLMVALSASVLLYLGLISRKLPSPRLLTALLTILVAAELVGASIFLPFNRATAPGALTSLRPAVAHLLSAANTALPGPPDRFLSISDIFFDPGDKQEIEIALQSQLSADALYDYIIATKQKEVLIPNLPLYYRLPTVDGYDGGVLPLRRYVTLERLYMPEEQVAIDGRLREHLDAVPAGRWLSLFNVRYVITDKVGDAWFDDVFYDLQMGASLDAGEEATVGYVPPMTATALGVVYQADGAIEGAPLAHVDVVFAEGHETALMLLADASTAGDRVARLTWEHAATPTEVRVRGIWGEGQVMLRGLSLIDERTGAFRPLVLSDSGRYRLVHSGDVKIYENLDVLPRAFFVSHGIIVSDDETALAVMRDPGFDPAAAVVLTQDGSAGHESGLAPGAPHITAGAETELLLYEPEHVVAAVNAPTDGWLLLSDAWYPGWEATVDGTPTPIERADILLRAVAVPQGEHHVEWVYRPVSFRLGAVISLCTLGLLLVGAVWVVLIRAQIWRSRRQSS